MPPAAPRVHVARLADLDPVTLYRLLRLRVDVFVVEQACAYPELDGVDLEPTTEHLWLEAQGEPVATLRTYVDDRGRQHLGRVATHGAHRGQGYAAALVRAALARAGGQAVHIGAQTYLEGWYAALGFERTGADYVEDGIPHLPMVRRP